MAGPRFMASPSAQVMEAIGQPNRKFRRAANSLAMKKIRKAKKATPLALQRAAVNAFRAAIEK